MKSDTVPDPGLRRNRDRPLVFSNTVRYPSTYFIYVKSAIHLSSRHVADLFIIFCACVLLFIAIISTSIFAITDTKDKLAACFSIVTIFLGCIYRIYIIQRDRLNLVDIFMYEIISILQLYKRMNIFHWAEIIKNKDIESIRFAGEENYITIYERKSDNLGFLSKSAVRHIVQFYQYFKMSRDITRLFENWKSSTEKAQVHFEVDLAAYFIAKSVERAEKALRSLFEIDDYEYRFFDASELKELFEGARYFIQKFEEKTRPAAEQARADTTEQN